MNKSPPLTGVDQQIFPYGKRMDKLLETLRSFQQLTHTYLLFAHIPTANNNKFNITKKNKKDLTSL